MRYPALIDHEPGVVGIVFPDLPGCVAAAATIDEALVNAEAVLRDWIDVAEEDGRSVPPPSALEDICVPAGSVLVSIPLVRPSGVPVRGQPLPRLGRGRLHRQRAQATRHDPPRIRGVDGRIESPRWAGEGGGARCRGGSRTAPTGRRRRRSGANRRGNPRGCPGCPPPTTAPASASPCGPRPPPRPRRGCPAPRRHAPAPAGGCTS